MKSHGVVKKVCCVQETANNLELLEVWVHEERWPSVRLERRTMAGLGNTFYPEHIGVEMKGHQSIQDQVKKRSVLHFRKITWSLV